MKLPRAPATLPRDFAEALGRAVAGFGFLEEALKHAIHALSRDRLGDTPTEAELDAWIARMEQVRGDSMGTLIENFVAACQRCGARRNLREELEAIRDTRNMLCHASWKVIATEQGGGWRPAFVSSRNRPVPDRLTVADLRRIRAQTLVAARRTVNIAREFHHDDMQAASKPQTEVEAERSRAQARRAQGANSSRPSPTMLDAAATFSSGNRADPRSHAWHPLDTEDYAEIWHRQRHDRGDRR